MGTKLRVAVIAPPWLALPVKGYGGIELVLEALVRSLIAQGMEVVVYANGERKLRGVETRSLYKKELYPDIYRPLNESVTIPAAHLLFALNDIARDGKFDVVHCHLEYIGPSILAWASAHRDIPPVVHTLHGPPFASVQSDPDIPDSTPYWDQLARHTGKLYFVGISDALMVPAPDDLRPYILPSVYNAIDLDHFPYQTHKKNYFATLARFNSDKAQHVAARLCAAKNYQLRMAGTVAGIESNSKLLFELANPMSPYRHAAEFRYYSDYILPYVLSHPKITYSGNLKGARKLKFLSEARALLFPINWEEPFGMAVIEALACGTPVVAMNRGAMPEIIEHGVTGFLAHSEQEFAGYMERVGEIDPAACRRAVREKFAADIMARAYIQRYREAIVRSQQ